MDRAGASACRRLMLLRAFQTRKAVRLLTQALHKPLAALNLLHLLIFREFYFYFSTNLSSDSSSFVMASSGADTFYSFDTPPNIHDDREFPSLSGASQTQYQNPGQAIWANANQRATQHTPVQRPQQQPTTHGSLPNSTSSQQQSQHAQEQVQQSLDDAFSTMSHLGSSLDEYRHGGQGGIGQLSSHSQPQPGNIEEFPPLGRNGVGEIGQDRRGNLMQSAAIGNFAGDSAFAQHVGQMQNRTGLPIRSNGMLAKLPYIY